MYKIWSDAMWYLLQGDQVQLNEDEVRDQKVSEVEDDMDNMTFHSEIVEFRSDHGSAIGMCSPWVKVIGEESVDLLHNCKWQNWHCSVWNMKHLKLFKHWHDIISHVLLLHSL